MSLHTTPNPAALAWALLRVLERVPPEDDPGGQTKHLVARLRAGDEIVIAIGDGVPSALDAARGTRVVRARLPLRAVEAIASSVPTLCCSPEGRWFVAVDGRRVRLDRKPTLRRLFCVLLSERSAHPGRAISRVDLLARVWPNERYSSASGANRLYFSVAMLRALGLRPWLLYRDDGYLIDPDAVLDLEETVATARTG